MNCKPGDMCVIVPDLPADEWARGYVVECVALDGFSGPPYWVVKPQLRDPKGHPVVSMADAILRPIHPGDVDEEEVDELFAAPPRQEVTA